MDRGQIVKQLFGVDRALVGVVHLQPLPGTPMATGTVDEMVSKAVAEATMYVEAGYHGIIIENMGDRPYVARAVGPEIVSAMTAAGQAIVNAVDLAIGVQILAGANKEALAVANAIGGAFVRVEGFVFAHVADEGLLQSDAGDLLRYRRAIDADHIRIFPDIKKKHSAHAITGDVDLAETAAAAEFFLADGVIVTGTATGHPTDGTEVKAVADRVSIPTLVGSGVNPNNVSDYRHADALIVGSFVKHDGLWSNDIDPDRLNAMAQAFTTSVDQG